MTIRDDLERKQSEPVKQEKRLSEISKAENNTKRITGQNNVSQDNEGVLSESMENTKLKIDATEKKKLLRREKVLLVSLLVIAVLFIRKKWLLGFIGIVIFVYGNWLYDNKDFIKEYSWKHFIYVCLHRKGKGDEDKTDEK